MISDPARIRKAARYSSAVTMVAAVIGSLVPHMGPPEGHHADKIIHVAGYAALTLQLVLAVNRPHSALFAGVSALIVGGGLELAQCWVPGRSGSWDDFAADLIGVAAGMAVARHALGTLTKPPLPSSR